MCGRRIEVIAVGSPACAQRRVPDILGVLTGSPVEVRSHDQESAVTIHIVNLFADPLATTEPGVVQTVTVHVEGLTDADAGTMYFKTADPAQFVSGNAIDSAPVVGGIATTQIVGVHVGPAVIQFKLVVTPKPTK